MKVRCIETRGAKLPQLYLDGSTGITKKTVFPLTPGKVYTVYAISTYGCALWYYVFDDDQHPYPVWKVSDLFEVADPSIPDSWEVGYIRPRQSEPGFPTITFPEWAHDHYFYERLIDGDEATMATFAVRRLELEP